MNLLEVTEELRILRSISGSPTNPLGIHIFSRESSADTELKKFIKQIFKARIATFKDQDFSQLNAAETNIPDIIFFIDPLPKLIKEIESKKKQYPYLPMVLLYHATSSLSDIDIHKLYDVGVDLVFFETSDPVTLKDFFKNLSLLISKSEVLKTFWDIHTWILQNIESSNGIKNEKIRERIREKLNIAFGHLREPNYTFDSRFDTTNEEFAYLTYFSILNEIFKDWIIIEEPNDKKINLEAPEFTNAAYAGKIILRKDVKIIGYVYKVEGGKYSKNANLLLKPLRPIKFVKTSSNNLNEFEIDKGFFEMTKRKSPKQIKYIRSYRLDDTLKPEIDSNNQEKNCIYEIPDYISAQIPLILLHNKVNDYEPRILFSMLSEIRNHLEFVHSPYGDLIRKKNISEVRDPISVIENCVMILNFVYMMTNNNWNFISEELEEKLYSAIKISYFRTMKGTRKMLVRGCIEKLITNDKNQIIMFWINRIDGKSIVEFKAPLDQKAQQMLFDIKKNDDVTVIFDIIHTQENGVTKSQFLKATEIIPH
ncbi:MAG: hypothetical protein K8F36_13470 [Melioribacteraceae bacterium]|nr:hypothetical protein [Melioribacteraceae bacterium]